MLRVIASSLKWKFVSLMIVVILLTVSVIGVFSYMDTSRTLQRDIEHFSEQILKQANFNLNQYYQSYEQGFLLLGSSAVVRDWLALSTQDTKDKAFTYYEIKDNYILPLMSRHPEILSISLLSDNGNEIHVENGYSRIVKDYSLRQEPWFEEVMAVDKLFVNVGKSRNYLPSGSQTGPLYVMSMVKRFGGTDIGLIKMDISIEPVQHILQEIDLGETGVSMVSGLAGQIIVHPDSEQITGKLPQDVFERISSSENGWFFRDDSRDMVIYETMAGTKWRTIAMIPFDEMNKSVVRVRNVTIITAIVALIMSSVIIVSLTSSITNRLTKLRSIIRKTKTGNIYIRAPEGGNDEVSEVSIAYNQMLDRLDESVRALADSQLKQKQAAMNAMQSQINSHFLYNTLESINSMANLVNHTGIETTAINLSRMLRYAANYEKTLVSLQEELNHTMRYLAICKMRFDDQITYDFSVEEECMKLYCLKAILQPIVENSLRHGIEKTGEAMHIHIHARITNEHLLIRVSDNGPGYSADAIELLQERIRESNTSESYQELTSIGLLNVHYRIRMLDRAPTSGLSLQNSEEGAVTEIRVLIRTSGEEVME